MRAKTMPADEEVMLSLLMKKRKLTAEEVAKELGCDVERAKKLMKALVLENPEMPIHIAYKLDTLYYLDAIEKQDMILPTVKDKEKELGRKLTKDEKIDFIFEVLKKVKRMDTADVAFVLGWVSTSTTRSYMQFLDRKYPTQCYYYAGTLWYIGDL